MTVTPVRDNHGNQLTDKHGRLLWDVQISAGFTADGKRSRPSKRVHGSEREANRVEHDLTEKAKVPAGSAKTLSAWIEEYLAHPEKPLAARTQELYHAMHRNRIAAKLGKLKLKDITTGDIATFLKHLREGKRLDDRKGKVGLATLGKYYRFLHMIFRQAVYERLLTLNPVDNVRPPAKEQASVVYLRSEEVQQIYKKLDGQPLILRVAFTTALTTGMRRGEICGLRWRDVEWEKKIIRVERSVYRRAGGQDVKTTKSASGLRTVPATERLVELLKAWKRECGMHPDGYIFTWPDGAHLRPDFLTSAWPRFLTNAGLPHIRFHGLRHTAASILITNGMPLNEVAQVLGDRPETINRIYVHVIRDAADRHRTIMENQLAEKPAESSATDQHIRSKAAP